ncbi:MAG TPA: cysteine desulfurase-like protein, partial [Chthoniobacterales bacterium]
MHTFPTDWARAQFPSLQLAIEGRQAIFLDGPAGTQVPEAVPRAVAEYYRKNNSNLGGESVTSRQTAEMVQQSREQLAEFFNAPSPAEIMFGQNMTSLTFALSRSLSRTWTAGDQVIVTSLDHDANVTPWRLAAEDCGVTVQTWEVDPEGCTLDLAGLARLLHAKRTRLVAVTLASNVTGTLVDVPGVCRLAHAAGAQVFVDAVHFAPHGPIDVQALDCDYLACSAYKFFGPHLGLCWGRRDLLENLKSYNVRPASNQIPGKWQAGTQNFEAIAGTGATLRYLRELGYQSNGQTTLRNAMEVIREREKSLSKHFLDGVRREHRLELFGIDDPDRCALRTPTFAVRVREVKPAVVAQKLAEAGIFVWSGDCYAVDLIERLHLADSGGIVRLGFVHYNTEEEIDRTLDVLATL